MGSPKVVQSGVPDRNEQSPPPCGTRHDSRSVNVLNLCITHRHRKPSQPPGHRRYSPPNLHDVYYVNLLNNIQQPLCIHYIRTELYSIPLTQFKIFNDTCMQHNNRDQFHMWV